ncbi:MAG: hypothetical protein NVSMB59_23820 [Vulcanimicrobiaceae bacterium]
MEAAVWHASPRKRVLVADDDDDVCTLLQAVLSPMCDLTVVHDAESALRLLAGGPPYDAIVTDFMLPGITGLELVERIRRAEGPWRVPILIISGHGALGIGADARAAGADAFLDKPFTLAQLRETMLALLSRPLRCA